MADDPDLTPDTPSGSIAGSIDPDGSGPDDATTAEIVAVVVAPVDGDGLAAPPAPAPARSSVVVPTDEPEPTAAAASSPAGAATDLSASGDAFAFGGPSASAGASSGASAGPPAASDGSAGASPGPAGAVAAARPSPASTVTPPVTPPRPVTPPVIPPTTTPVGRPPAVAAPKADWAAEVADRIDDVVAKVRANTSDKLVGIARTVVYGLLAAVMGGVALVLLIILAIRLLDVIIPGEVWIPYLVLGAIFLAAGLFMWSKRKTGPNA